MDNSIVFAKTAKGAEEIQDRKYGIPLKLRHLLIIVDGKSNVEELLKKGAGLPDITEKLAKLEREEFIASQKPGIAEIKVKLIAIAQETLGTDANIIVKKIKAAPSTREGLQSAIDSCTKLVKLTIDEKKADELVENCRQVIF